MKMNSKFKLERVNNTMWVKSDLQTLHVLTVWTTHEIYYHLPFKPSRCIKASFYNPENTIDFPTTDGFRKKITRRLAYQYMPISFTSSHLHSLQVENCGSNSQLVVDEDDNGKFSLERVNGLQTLHVLTDSSHVDNAWDILTINYKPFTSW